MFCLSYTISQNLVLPFLSKIKKAQTTEDSFENILISFKRKPKLLETDRSKEFYDNFFSKLVER